jgi:hypothetical protein
MEQVALKLQNVPEQLRILTNDLIKVCSVQEQLRAASEQDDLIGRILDVVRRGTLMREITVSECSEKDGQLYYRGRRYVPEDPELQLDLIK